MHLNKLFIILILSIGVLIAKPLTWEECVHLAKQNNKELAIAREKLQELTIQKNIAAAGAELQVNSGISVRESGSAESGSKPGMFNSENRNNSQSLSLSAKKLIYDGSQTKKSIELAEEKIQQQKYNYEINEANIRLTLRQYFCELLRSQELLELNKKIAARRAQQLELVTLRYNAGLEHKGSYLTAKANLNQVLNDQEQQKRNIEINRQKLSFIIGINNNIDQVSSDLLLKSTIQQKPDFSLIVSENPLLKEAVSARLQKQYSADISRADYLPEVYISSSLGKSFSDQAGSRLQNDSWSIGADLSFTIFDANKKGNTVAQSESQLKQSEIELENNRWNIALTLESAWNDLLNSADNIKVARDFLTAAEERSTIASAQYSSGLITFDNWTIIEDNLISVQKNYLNSQIDALLKEAKWINAKGGTLDEK